MVRGLAIQDLEKIYVKMLDEDLGSLLKRAPEGSNPYTFAGDFIYKIFHISPAPPSTVRQLWAIIAIFALSLIVLLGTVAYRVTQRKFWFARKLEMRKGHEYWVPNSATVFSVFMLAFIIAAALTTWVTLRMKMGHQYPHVIIYFLLGEAIMFCVGWSTAAGMIFNLANFLRPNQGRIWMRSSFLDPIVFNRMPARLVNLIIYLTPIVVVFTVFGIVVDGTVKLDRSNYLGDQVLRALDGYETMANEGAAVATDQLEETSRSYLDSMRLFRAALRSFQISFWLIAAYDLAFLLIYTLIAFDLSRMLWSQLRQVLRAIHSGRMIEQTSPSSLPSYQDPEDPTAVLVGDDGTAMIKFQDLYESRSNSIQTDQHEDINNGFPRQELEGSSFDSKICPVLQGKRSVLKKTLFIIGFQVGVMVLVTAADIAMTIAAALRHQQSIIADTIMIVLWIWAVVTFVSISVVAFGTIAASDSGTLEPGQSELNKSPGGGRTEAEAAEDFVVNVGISSPRPPSHPFGTSASAPPATLMQPSLGVPPAVAQRSPTKLNDSATRASFYATISHPYGGGGDGDGVRKTPGSIGVSSNYPIPPLPSYLQPSAEWSNRQGGEGTRWNKTSSVGFGGHAFSASEPGTVSASSTGREDRDDGEARQESKWSNHISSSPRSYRTPSQKRSQQRPSTAPLESTFESTPPTSRGHPVDDTIPESRGDGGPNEFISLAGVSNKSPIEKSGATSQTSNWKPSSALR